MSEKQFVQKTQPLKKTPNTQKNQTKNHIVISVL